MCELFAPGCCVILIDSSVWIDLLRERQTVPVLRVRRILLEELACIAPVILQELLQGARSGAQLSLLRSRFSALPMLSPSAATYAEAGALFARCRWAGITPRSPHDCLIAQTAIEHAVPLLHDDRDFERMAEVEPRLRLVSG